MTDKDRLEIFEGICKEIEESEIGLRKIIVKHGVSTSTFYDWMDKDKRLSERYARAKEIQAHNLAEAILDIADDKSQDTITAYNSSGIPYEKENKEWVSRSNIRIEARKWLASKLLPKKYGSQIDHTIKGSVTIDFSEE